jgi:hypothetical protein
MEVKKKKIMVELDLDAQVIIERKQTEILEQIGKKPTKQEAILILIKQ